MVSNSIVLIIVAIAIFLVGRRLYRRFSNKAKGGPCGVCGTCSDCIVSGEKKIERSSN